MNNFIIYVTLFDTIKAEKEIVKKIFAKKIKTDLQYAVKKIFFVVIRSTVGSRFNSLLSHSKKF